MILTDQMGNAMYAEIPAVLIAQKAPLLQIEKVYTIKRFRIANARPTYRSVDGPFMMYITFYSIIELCRDPPTSFPQYIYRLIPYNDIDPHGANAKKFHDVLGIITEVSTIEAKQGSTQSSSSQFRNIFIKDLSDHMMKVTLWGDKALHFSYDSVYDHENQKPIVVLFVGCLPKEFRGNTYLSGGAACHWYFNPAIQEAEPFYDKICSGKILVQLPPISKEQIPLHIPIETEYKNLRHILDLGPYGLPKHGCDCTVTITSIAEDSTWWYIACKICIKKMTTNSTGYQCSTCGSTEYTFRYKLNFIASDETAESRMFCYENIAKVIVGRPCSSLITSVNNTSSIPPQLAAIVSLKFTFTVVFTERSFDYEEKTLLIKSIVASHGRERSLPQIHQNIDILGPSTPIKPMTSRMLTCSPIKGTPSMASPKDTKDSHTACEPKDITTHDNKASLSSFESPSKRAKQKHSTSDENNLPTSEDIA